MAGFWSRLERWLLDLQKDRARLARMMQVAYWISMGFVILGFVIALLVLAGEWEP